MEAQGASATDESALVQSLRAGDEQAFATLVDRHTPGLLRVARTCVHDQGAAQDVVQETWLALLDGLDRVGQRASLQTWLYRAVLDRGRRRGIKDARSAPRSAPTADAPDGPTVHPSRFLPDDDPVWPGHWAQPPTAWQRDPQLQSAGLLVNLRCAIEALPARQREALVLRDVEGLTTGQVAEVLGLDVGSTRMLLHRGRAKVRQSLEEYLT